MDERPSEYIMQPMLNHR